MKLILQNRIMYFVMPRIIGRKNLSQLLVLLVGTIDIRYSFIHITATVNRVIMIMYLH